MKVKDVIGAIERYAPSDTVEEWDNVGLMLGGRERECNGVMTCLDLTFDVAKQAADAGCDLIVTHHPFIFRPVDRLTDDTAKGRTAGFLFAHGISVYSAHTNLDKAEAGLSRTLAKMFGGREFADGGCGCFASLPETSAGELASRVAAALGDPGVKVGSPEKTVRRIYVVSGAGGGGDELCEAMRGGDALVTGEVRHHVFTEACEQGFPVIEFSHYYSEIICCDILKDMIKSAFRDLKVIAAKCGCPYKTLEEL